MTQTRSDVDDEGTNLNPCVVIGCAGIQAQQKQHKPGTSNKN